MRDEQCVRFLQWALPQLHMRWPGFRKVRRQVCKRVDRRTRELGLGGVEDYRSWLAEHADEWARFDLVLCRNLVFTYFDEDWQREILERIVDAMHTGAALVLGAHEQLPEQLTDTAHELSAWFEKQAIYRSGNRRINGDILNLMY